MTPIFTAVLGPVAALSKMLRERPALASERMAASELLPDIHWLYVGDTPLHLAAAAVRPEAVEALIAARADVRAINRRRATALHYACDPRPVNDRWAPADQQKILAMLVAAGADPNAADMDKTAPLHRAVRARSPAAVATLLKLGARAGQRNGKGSSPIDLTKHSTGAGGTANSKDARDEIVALLEAAGA